jgi:hypothetical protein
VQLRFTSVLIFYSFAVNEQNQNRSYCRFLLISTILQKAGRCSSSYRRLIPQVIQQREQNALSTGSTILLVALSLPRLYRH